MRKVRGLFVALLLLVPVFFQCDLFQLYLYDFDEFYFTSFYLPADTAYEDMLQEIEERAKEYQVMKEKKKFLNIEADAGK